MQPTREKAESQPKQPKSSAKDGSGKPRDAPRRPRQDAPDGPVLREERDRKRQERHRREATTDMPATSPAQSDSAKRPKREKESGDRRPRRIKDEQSQRQRNPKRSEQPKSKPAKTGALDPGSDVAEPIAAQLGARDLASLAVTRNARSKFSDYVAPSLEPLTMEIFEDSDDDEDRFREELERKCKWKKERNVGRRDFADAHAGAKDDKLRAETAKVLAGFLATKKDRVIAFIRDDKEFKLHKLRQCVVEAIDVVHAKRDEKFRTKLKNLVPK